MNEILGEEQSAQAVAAKNEEDKITRDLVKAERLKNKKPRGKS